MVLEYDVSQCEEVAIEVKPVKLELAVSSPPPAVAAAPIAHSQPSPTLSDLCASLDIGIILEEDYSGGIEVIQAIESGNQGTSGPGAIAIADYKAVHAYTQQLKLEAVMESTKYQSLLEHEHSAFTEYGGLSNFQSSRTTSQAHTDHSISVGSSLSQRHIAISPNSDLSSSEDEIEYDSHAASLSSKPLNAPYCPPSGEKSTSAASSNDQILRFVEQQSRGTIKLQEYKDDTNIIITGPDGVPLAPPLRGYPQPQADGEYVMPTPPPPPAMDWRERFAADLEASEQLGSDYATLQTEQRMVMNPDLKVQRSESLSVLVDSDSDEDADPVWKQIRTKAAAARELRRTSEAAWGKPMQPAEVPWKGALLTRTRAEALADRARARQAAAAATMRKKTIRPPSPPPPPVVRHIKCGICQDDEVLESASVVFGEMTHSSDGMLRTVKQCNHRYCKECLTSYLSHEIENGKVMQIRCPGRDAKGAPCQCIAPTQWLKIRVGAAMYLKYERFLKMKQDDSYRSCPNKVCLHVQQHRLGSGEEMQCEKCATKYCFSHDLAHVNSTCAAYKKKLAEESKDSIQHIDENTVRCPWPLCRTKTMKSSGCNHMTCSQCNAEYCYLCGGFYFGGLHFNSCNILGCPGMKSSEGGANSRNTWWRFFFRLFIGLPLLIVLGACAIGFFIAAELFYIVWLFGLSPIWIIYACVVANVNMDHSRKYDHQRRIEKCTLWGVELARGLLC